MPPAGAVAERRAAARGYAGGGAGLGLAIVASLTHAAGGTVKAGNSDSLGGACVQVEIPLAGG